MPCDLLRLNILRREDQRRRRQLSISEIYDIFAYCEVGGHQLGPFECHINRDEILQRFREVLPNISLASLWRGGSQEPIFDKEVTQVSALEDVTALGKEIFSAFPDLIREYMYDSKSISLFTNDSLIPWEVLYDEKGFVSLNHSFGIIPTSRRRITPIPRLKYEKLRILLIVDPLDNLPQARIEMDKILSLLKNDPRVEKPIVLAGRKMATWSEVRRYLREESFDILHVAAHTRFDKDKNENTGIILSEGSVLHPTDVFYDIRGDSPWLIFLNACESAMAKDMYFDKYNELSGLADAFIAAGALTYIGTTGPINDISASEISVNFYKKLLKGSTVAESLRESKSEYFEYNDQDPSWSLFRVYGNPSQRIELQKVQDSNENRVKNWHLKTGSCDPLRCAVDLGLDIDEVMMLLSKICKK
jgi:CHAT domain